MNRRRFLTASALTSAASSIRALALPATPTTPACKPLPALPAPPSPAITRQLFPGFQQSMVPVEGAVINTLVGGSGPPLLLLHGNPETHVAWHKIAPQLAQHFTIVLTDLRGYGDSSKPDGGPQHINYAPRTMAADQVQVMRHLGFPRFAVAGHDRGGRVAHRMALDYPEAISRLAVLDIAPTLTMYRETNQDFATRYVWWFFLIQPAPGPERMIGLDPEAYLREHMTPAATPTALGEYLRCFCNAAAIHAGCEDYRAAAGIGLELDAADEAAGHKIQAPLLALWGAQGTVGHLYDVLATWRAKATSVTGKALDCGHFMPEEQPTQVYDELLKFFTV